MTAVQESPQGMAAQINALLSINAPAPATRANGWFGGYGCRWCEASRAWFTVVPFDAGPAARKLAEVFKSAGAREVSITNEGGVSEADGGRGLQISAYV